jgi:hypothetical protein
MRQLKAKSVIVNPDYFITLCSGLLPKRLLDKGGRKAIINAIVDFNEDRSITISGELLDIRRTEKRMYLSVDEAKEINLNDLALNWRKRIYVEGWYQMKDTQKYSITIQEPWFVDFSLYDFCD